MNRLLRFLPSFIRDPMQSIRYKFIQPSLSSHQMRLLEIIQSHPDVKNIIVFPPSIDWHAQLFQRPQQMAQALSDNEVLIFYLQHRENWDDTPFNQIRPNLYLCNLPVETFRCIENPFIYLFTWNKFFQSVFNSPRIIYDYVDDLRAFPGSYSRLQRDHQHLLRDAEIVLATARRLYQEVLPVRSDALHCPNGVNYEHFSLARQFSAGPVPEDIHPLLDRAYPIIGYHGALAQWFDYELLACVASARRDLTFVLIGPDHDHSLPDSLLNQDNIHWLGVKPYQELPDYLRCFDAAMIPFRLMDITHATSPIKLFEYFAAGKPVVATAMQESQQYPGVLIAGDCKDFNLKLDQALDLRLDPQYLDLSERVARQNTWDMRARQLVDNLIK